MGELLEWFRTLTWKCDVCGEERPDEFISIWKTDESDRYDLPAGSWIRNWKYCNDREVCCERVRAHQLIEK